ncbi:MAG: peptidylprolyl isomerase [Opitutae bacterium]
MKLIINGQEIPQAFFEQRLQEIYPEVQQRLGDKPPAIIELSARDEARERVIEEALIEQEIDRVNPPADEALVQQELKKMLKKQETKRQLKQAGRNREIVINNMRKQLYRRLQAYEIMEAAMHQDPASDEDVEEFYNKNLNHFKTREQIHASHILIRDKSDIGREKLDAVIEALDSGRDFEELAREFSEDTSAEQGGDLGWLPRGQTVAKFEKVAFSLELDEISDPFETQFGWHIVRLHERQDARTQSLEEVSEQIAMMLLRERRNESYRLFLQDLKEKATIEEVKP